MLRESFSGAFKQEGDIEVVGQASTGLEAVDMVRQLRPDVLVTDIGMPDLNGIEAARRISRDFPEVKVIGVSMHSGEKYVREMFKAGASGYLLKNCTFGELAGAIRAVAAGKTYVSPSIGDMVVQTFLNKAEGGPSAFDVLSAREREVLQQLAEGKTTKQAALALHISHKTVEVHRVNIMHKLGFDNIAQLTKYAIQEGLTEPEP